MNQGLCFVHDSTRSPFIEWVLPKCYTPPKKHAKLQNTWNIMKLWKHQKSHSSTKRGACLRRPERTWVPRTNFMYQDVPNPNHGTNRSNNKMRHRWPSNFKQPGTWNKYTSHYMGWLFCTLATVRPPLSIYTRGTHLTTVSPTLGK